MRLFPAVLCLFPMAAMADDIQVPSRVDAVTVFPQGAAIHRVAEYEIPAGTHRLILTDMPVVQEDSLRLTTSAAALGAVSYRDDFVPPRDPARTARVEAAKAEVDAARAAIQALKDKARAAELAADAARDRIAFLAGLGQGEGLAGAGTTAIRDLVALVGEEGLAARREIHAAEQQAREILLDLPDLEEELVRAKQALAALETGAGERAYLTVVVTAEAPVTGTLELRYMGWDAGWTPAYDFHLTTGAAPALTVERGAFVRQATGEDWQDVALTLSTAEPTARSVPGEVFPWLRRITEPRPDPRPYAKEELARSQGSAGFAAAAADAAPAPVMAEPVIATGDFDGLSVTYDYPRPVSIANGADALKIGLGDLSVTPQVYARAVPALHETAFVMGEFTNDTGALIAGTEAAQFYLDGTYIGRRPIDLISEGDKATLAFGPIEGLRLERRVKDRQAGDRGVLTRSNRQEENVVITASNLTGRDWDVRLTDRVPYSEQEDLVIDWTASPMPDDSALDNQRGVLEWRFALPGGAEQEITLDHTITWPGDMILQ
ncbi:DUF4139 domain-containing protein [Pseudooceanicola aestuarii]|uniref:DUF4139 domain-containing protein n=1 Tax=Pseudooceanicola aestuarii TaxID=2697319 RepID=UPI0013D3A8F0|nr:DUF4139 domain-containing protein [Pseudooceanicola aestuarii]